MLHAFRQRAFNRPPSSQTGTEHAFSHAQASFPLRDDQRFSVERQTLIASTVLTLEVTQRPSTVVRRVVAVIVFAIDLMSRRRPRAHIFEERGEVLPSSADPNPSAAVVGIVRRVGALAAFAHPAPHLELRRRTETMRAFAAGLRSARTVAALANAAEFKVAHARDGLRAALAATTPREVLRLSWIADLLKRREATSRRRRWNTTRSTTHRFPRRFSHV